MANIGLDNLVKESLLTNAVSKELGKQHKEILAEARKEQPEFNLLWDTFTERMVAALIPPLVDVYDQAIGTTFGRTFSSKQDLIGTLLSFAHSWARLRARASASSIIRTTRLVVQDAFATVVSTPGMTMGDFKDLIGKAFSLDRISKIAITETTEARFNGVREAQGKLSNLGFRTELVWFTRNDERVCPICGPLHETAETYPGSGVWDSEGIIVSQPAHVGCRCGTGSRAI